MGALPGCRPGLGCGKVWSGRFDGCWCSGRLCWRNWCLGRLGGLRDAGGCCRCGWGDRLLSGCGGWYSHWLALVALTQGAKSLWASMDCLRVCGSGWRRCPTPLQKSASCVREATKSTSSATSASSYSECPSSYSPASATSCITSSCTRLPVVLSVGFLPVPAAPHWVHFSQYNFHLPHFSHCLRFGF